MALNIGVNLIAIFWFGGLSIKLLIIKHYRLAKLKLYGREKCEKYSVRNAKSQKVSRLANKIIRERQGKQTKKEESSSSASLSKIKEASRSILEETPRTHGDNSAGV